MFTGIIEELGEVTAWEPSVDAARITVRAPLAVSDARHGDSISVSGVCLTVVDQGPDWFTADVMAESIAMSTFSDMAAGQRVNIERAALVGDRLGGHIVQGHVDGRGTFISAVAGGEFWTVRIGFSPELAKYFVYKGSVAVEGISLTIAALADDYFEIAVIPKTWEMTNFSSLRPGDPVNLEVDIIAKYVERIMSTR